jgi:hypothetical protein
MSIAAHILCFDVDNYLLHCIRNMERFVDTIYLAWSPYSWAYKLPRCENPTDIYQYDFSGLAVTSKSLKEIGSLRRILAMRVLILLLLMVMNGWLFKMLMSFIQIKIGRCLPIILSVLVQI